MLSRLEYSKHFPIVIFLVFFISAAWVSESLSSVKISSSSIAITADGKTLLVVNPDSNSLTLIDTIQNVKLREISVGIRPNAVAIDHISQLPPPKVVACFSAPRRCDVTMVSG